MPSNNYDPKTNTATCWHCKGKGRLEHECENSHFRNIANHPCNVQKSKRYGYSNCVQQCGICGHVREVATTDYIGGDVDNHITDYGIGDPFELVTKDKLKEVEGD